MERRRARRGVPPPSHAAPARSGPLHVGDVARCLSCGYTFVHRRSRAGPACPRCRATRVERWHRSDASTENGGS